MSKHVGVYMICRDAVVIYNCALVVCNKNKDMYLLHDASLKCSTDFERCRHSP